MLIISNIAIYMTKDKKRNKVRRYSEFHVTHPTIFNLLTIMEQCSRRVSPIV